MFRNKKFFSTSLFLVTLIGLNFGSSNQASKAESYVGIQSGLVFGGLVGGTTATVNTNFPSATGPQPFLGGTELTQIKLDESVSIGVKAGHFFKATPFIGIEGEINYSKPDVLRQKVTLTNQAFTAFPGGSKYLHRDELSADVHDLSAAVSLLASSTRFKHFQPYIGVGPNVHLFMVRGNGAAQANPMSNVFIDGPEIDENKLAVGVQAKTGIRFPVSEHFAVDLEYKFNYSPVKLDVFRNKENLRGDFLSHQAAVGLVYTFGKK